MLFYLSLFYSFRFGSLLLFITYVAQPTLTCYYLGSFSTAPLVVLNFWVLHFIFFYLIMWALFSACL